MGLHAHMCVACVCVWVELRREGEKIRIRRTEVGLEGLAKKKKKVEKKTTKQGVRSAAQQCDMEYAKLH